LSDIPRLNEWIWSAVQVRRVPWAVFRATSVESAKIAQKVSWPILLFAKNITKHLDKYREQ
jgi:hypothetical protein